MFKQKYLGFLLIGLLLGIGLFGFIGYSIKQDSADISTSNNQVEQKDLSEKKLSVTSPPSISIDMLKNNETKSHSEKQAPEKDIRTRLFDHRMKKMEEDRTRKVIGKLKLKELIDNQPFELSGLFELSDDKYDGKEYKYIISSFYWSHLVEEVDVNWSAEAEAFLYRYFSIQKNPNFIILRVDCRLSNCEVAGVLNSVSTNNKRELGLLIGSLFSEVFKNSSEFNELFSGVNWPYFALQETSSDTQIPFSFFIGRKSPFTHPDAVL